ncbi:hypothetical protein FTUN_8993 (plasmid) [Frigoriglobus tundricola]|uniref:Uncharacterized protein n=2 Tax=Frigoriglobus tundricola TaxID=2774151 RepID=A0A6M5Z530_9BACT|nr:hypothetical protein FTUN_8993 [Frigoriglobus tundricola]
MFSTLIQSRWSMPKFVVGVTALSQGRRNVSIRIKKRRASSQLPVVRPYLLYPELEDSPSIPRPFTM